MVNSFQFAARPFVRAQAIETGLREFLEFDGGVWRFVAPPDGGVIHSVAVLPFENVGGDPDAEYLSDGIAETLISRLSQLPDLKVIARSTAFHFKGKDVDLQEAGRQMSVHAVLAGRLSQRNDRLVVGVEMEGKVDYGFQSLLRCLNMRE